jgi:hypothetical protein
MKDKTGRPKSSITDQDNYYDLEKRAKYIPASSIKTVMIIDSAITTDKVANDSINNDKIADGAVDTDQLANDAVTMDKVADDVVAEMIKYAIVLGG